MTYTIKDLENDLRELRKPFAGMLALDPVENEYAVGDVALPEDTRSDAQIAKEEATREQINKHRHA